jgi:SAM-dependent methyltransferase
MKEQWRKGKESEIQFWEDWLKTGGLQWPHTYRNRQDPSFPLQDYVARCLPASHVVSILDVGAGPLTILGKVCRGHTLSIVAVDVFAKEYDELLKKYSITPLIRTRYAEAEKLTDTFPEQCFDVVHIRNALDHSYSPVRGIVQMLRVLKRGGVLIMVHASDEAERESYRGLHQWNICAEGNDLIVWSKNARHSVRAVLGNAASIAIRLESSEYYVEIRKY